MSSLEQLKAIICRILDAEKNAYGELFAACDALFTTLLELTAVDIEDEQNRAHIRLDTGNAIGVTWAAMCIKEIMRTKRFMDGVFQAASELIKAKPDAPIHVLYAGTGPFATLILPLLARFSSQQVQFTFLDINEHSLAYLQKMFESLGLTSYIHHIEKTDAAKWVVPAEMHFDMFITETMLNGLQKEPQVSICMNIVPQLGADVVMIPQEIILKAALIDDRQRSKYRLSDGVEESNGIHILDTIFTLNLATIRENAAAYQAEVGKTYAFPAYTVALPKGLTDTHANLSILTDIITYDQEHLGIDVCSLTTPVRLCIFDGSTPAPPVIYFQYQIAERPGIQFVLVDEPVEA